MRWAAAVLVLALGCGDDGSGPEEDAGRGPDSGMMGDAGGEEDAGPTDDGGARPDVPAVACTVDGECDDGVYCNGTETCAAGACAMGAPPDCADEMECTVDACDESMRTCTNLAVDADMD